nr:reverse transcriptase domain-containing protein [Tanacetum cinerariifolium]
MTIPITTSTTDSHMHNNIMAAGSRDCPPMLATGRYAQWQSCFLRYIDTIPNCDALRKCILQGPYTPSTVTIPSVQAIDDTLAVTKRTAIDTILNMSLKNKAHYDSKLEAIHLLLTGIGDEIYSTVDACKIAHEIWIAIGRLQKGRKIAKPITPPSESASEEDNYPEQAQRNNDMQKNLALIAKYFKKIYKPTNNNIRTSLNSKNKNVDTYLWYKNDNQTGQFGNQRTVTNVGARETVDFTYHKEKMLLCKQAEKGVPLQVEQSDWLADTDKEIVEQELKTHYSYMAKIQEADQNAEDERAALLIVNLKLDVDENKKIQKQLKKANTSLAHELKECKSILMETSRTLGEFNSILDRSNLSSVPSGSKRGRRFNDDLQLVDPSSSKLPHDQTSNPTSSTNPTPKGRIRRSSKQKVENSHFEENLTPVDTMTDNRTMAEILRAPTEGCTEAIVVPPILAKQFELKHSLINMMTSEQFFGLEKDNPHDHGQPAGGLKKNPHDQSPLGMI